MKLIYSLFSLQFFVMPFLITLTAIFRVSKRNQILSLILKSSRIAPEFRKMNLILAETTVVYSEYMEVNRPMFLIINYSKKGEC